MSTTMRRSSNFTTAAQQSLFSGDLDGDRFSQKRLEEQQAHHKQLLKKRLNAKRRGGNNNANSTSNPDHPANVRARELDRQKQEKIAQRRLELKRREQRKKAQMRHQQRKASTAQTSFTVVKDGRVHLGQQQLTAEQRKARLKAKAELQRRQRRETLEANQNPFDPTVRSLEHQSSDIWNNDDTAAIIANADMLHAISTTRNAHGAKTYSYDLDFDFDSDLYDFDDAFDRKDKPESPKFKPRMTDFGSAIARSPSQDDDERPNTSVSRQSTNSSLPADDIDNLLNEIM